MRRLPGFSVPLLEMAKKNGAGLTGARRIPWEREGGEMDQQHPKLGTMPSRLREPAGRRWPAPQPWGGTIALANGCEAGLPNPIYVPGRSHYSRDPRRIRTRPGLRLRGHRYRQPV